VIIFPGYKLPCVHSSKPLSRRHSAMRRHVVVVFPAGTIVSVRSLFCSSISPAVLDISLLIEHKQAP